MTLPRITERLHHDPKWLKRLPWLTQVGLVAEVVDQGNLVTTVAAALNTTPKWVKNCLKVHLAILHKPEWNCRHARSLQDAVTTANIRAAAQKRTLMEKRANEAPASPRPVFG